MRRVHHIAIIASDYDRSRRFYVETLGLPVIREVYREERNSWKCDLDAGNAQLELFSFPDPPPRPTRPEACGLRHLAFEVDDIYAACAKLAAGGVTINRPPRDGRMAFVRSPDLVSIELLQKGAALPSAEPWASMANSGTW